METYIVFERLYKTSVNGGMIRARPVKCANPLVELETFTGPVPEKRAAHLAESINQDFLMYERALNDIPL